MAQKRFHRHFETPGLPLYWIIIAYIILGWFFPVIGSDWPVGHHLYDRPCGDEHL